MVSGTFSSFSDPFSFQQALQGGDFELVPTARGIFRARLTQVRLNKVWMTRGEESLPRILVRSTPTSRSMIAFLTDTKQPGMYHCGTGISSDAVVVNNSNVMHRRTDGPCRWGSMSLAPDELASASKAICGRELDVSSLASLIRPNSALMARLLYLHRELGRLVEESAENLVHAEAMRAIDTELVYLMVRCLDEGLPLTATLATRNHARIVQRLEEFLTENLHQPLYLAEICAATGASERSLRSCCHEHFGMGPVQFLWLRRMHLVRRALLLATPETSSVTQLAMDHGFWETGRFSTQYRSLFGESPSVTLRRSIPSGLARH